VGYTPISLIVNDPNGDLDLISGVHVSRDGAGLQFRWITSAAVR
jgi:hypothetical protein